MDLAAQEGAGGEDHRARPAARRPSADDAGDAPAATQQILDLALAQLEAGLRLEQRLHRPARRGWRSAWARGPCTAGPLLRLSMRNWMPPASIARPMMPSSASISRTRWPRPSPPMAGLQDMAPIVASLCVPAGCAHPSGRSPPAASQPAWPPPMTMTSWCAWRVCAARRAARQARKSEGSRCRALRICARAGATAAAGGWSGTGGLVFGIAGLLALIAFLPRLAAVCACPTPCCWRPWAARSASRSSLPASLLDALPGPGAARLPRPAAPFRDHRRPAALGVPADPPVRHRNQARRRELLDDLGPILILAVVAVLVTTAAAGLAVWCGLELRARRLPAGRRDHRHHRSERRHRRVPRGRRAAPADAAGRRREPAQRCRRHRALHLAAAAW